MSPLAIFFLVIITLVLALLLALLGLMTIPSNLLGWFLLLLGTVYFGGIIVVYWIRGIRFWRPRATGGLKREEQSDWSFWFIVVGMIAAFYLPPIEYLFFDAILSRLFSMQIIGLLLILLGSMLFLWARRTLGDFYSGHVSIIEGQPLLQTGPYRYIRHPAYGGYLLIVLGLAVGYSSLAGVAAILFLLLPSVTYRIQVEDKLLMEQFGVEFDQYARHTKRLLPGIW